MDKYYAEIFKTIAEASKIKERIDTEIRKAIDSFFAVKRYTSGRELLVLD